MSPSVLCLGWNLPIPEALEILKNNNKNREYCYAQARKWIYRDPLWDAMRQAFMLEGERYCPSDALTVTYPNNGAVCFSECKTLGVIGYPLDCIEKCKDTPGVLFGSESKD